MSENSSYPQIPADFNLPAVKAQIAYICETNGISLPDPQLTPPNKFYRASTFAYPKAKNSSYKFFSVAPGVYRFLAYNFELSLEKPIINETFGYDDSVLTSPQ